MNKGREKQRDFIGTLEQSKLPPRISFFLNIAPVFFAGMGKDRLPPPPPGKIVLPDVDLVPIYMLQYIIAVAGQSDPYDRELGMIRLPHRWNTK